MRVGWDEQIFSVLGGEIVFCIAGHHPHYLYSPGTGHPHHAARLCALGPTLPHYSHWRSGSVGDPSLGQFSGVKVSNSLGDRWQVAKDGGVC